MKFLNCLAKTKTGMQYVSVLSWKGTYSVELFKAPSHLCVCVCVWFNNTVSRSDYIVLDDRMSKETVWKKVAIA
jgi:hypothetical protein